jgi:hypothetical protein
MQRSGQCKCGVLLTFDEGADGFKGRCPKCGAVVRLRVPNDPKEPAQATPPPTRKKARPPRPSDPRLSVVSLREPGPAVPGGPDPDATAPFEPVQEVILEPWTEPPAPPPTFARQYRLTLVLGAITLMAVGAGGVAFFWWWSGQ